MLKRELVQEDPSSWPPEKKKKRRSRWGPVTDTGPEKVVIPGMPTMIPENLSDDQQQQYILHLQIEETSRRLRTGDLGIPLDPEERSPSPEPIYNTEGKRLNTREYRTRKKLEEERHDLVQKAFDMNVDYKPPADYKAPIVKVIDKVMIPQDDYPGINFVGLLIGPRGNTLKTLVQETGAKIIIRGKGSVKEGKIGRKDGQPLPGEDEPLHAYITANNPEFVKKAADKINEIIKQGIDVPEGQNDLRRQQLRELALLNGTLRENDGLSKLKQLQQAQSIVTNTIICTKCGGAGHIEKDCKQSRPGDTLRPLLDTETPVVDRAKMDSEYMSLMAELGEGPPPHANKPDLRHTSISITTTASIAHNRFGGGHQEFTPRRSRFNEPPGGGSSMLNPPWLRQAQQQHPGPPGVAHVDSLTPPPWQQQAQNSGGYGDSYGGPPNPSMYGTPPPPPPSTTSTGPPWGTTSPGTAPPGTVPPGPHPPWQAPPPAPPGIGPWQAPTTASAVATPPPPSSQYGAPPPPPPGSINLASLGLNPFAPPPPPPQ